jgi:hypothetical protein
VLWEKCVSTKGGATAIKRERNEWDDMFHANDLLVSNGKSLIMGRLMIDPKSGELSMARRDDPYLSSGNARSGRGLFPFGFLYDRRDAAERPPKYYTPIRYQLTLWSYAGTEGLLLAFTGDSVLGVGGRKDKGSQYYTGDEWELFARRPDIAAEPAKDTAPLWSAQVPRGSVQALLPAGPVLFVAGPADRSDPAGGALRSYSTQDGSRLGEIRLDDAPVFDGMAAAGGRLYISTQGGRILCLGKT